MKTDFEMGMMELEKHANRSAPLNVFDFCGLTTKEAKAIIKEIQRGEHLHELVRALLDDSITFGEYILTKKDMIALADTTGYELPKD